MLAKLNKLTNWQAAIIIAVIGFAVFFTGLNGAFQGDDTAQIVNNPVIHSITHVRLFFDGGTFYVGKGIAPLSGIYFRPLMTTVFSLIYTLFGLHPFYYHLFQLLLCIGSAIILYMFFKYSFKPALALFLALVFLVHPINSQVAFATPAMQDALFFFFGILGLWLLVRFKSKRSLILVALCLLLSLLAKETGILFVALSLLYLFWWNRRRLISFIEVMILPIVTWFGLRLHAIGLGSHSHIAPIDSLKLGGRLLTAPSIIQFYITKLVFPWRLASAYYWTYPMFSIRHTLLPLAIDVAALGLIVYLAFVVRRKASKAMFYRYLFFAIWCVLGLLTTSQIVPLDMTACETWFYFSTAGLLGMIGVILTVTRVGINRKWLLILGVLLVTILGARTAARGLDWRNEYTLASKDIVASRQDYTAAALLADSYYQKGQFSSAIAYDRQSVTIYPTLANYQNLGLALVSSGDYKDAMVAYKNGLKYGSNSSLNDDIGTLMLIYGNDSSSVQFLTSSLDIFPNDSALWEYLAAIDYRDKDNAAAKAAITQAAANGQVPQILYDSIMNDTPITIGVSNTGKNISLP